MRKNFYDLEILVNDKPVYEYTHEGDTYIEGRKSSTFKIRFKNPTASRVLIVPSVDGISTMDGNPAGPDSPGMIVPAYGTVDIPGWMVDLNKSSEFTFQDRERSYAASRDTNTTNTGVIGVLVFAEAVVQHQVIYHVVDPSYPPYNPFVPRRITTGGISPFDNNYLFGLNNTCTTTLTSNVGTSCESTTTPNSTDNLGVGWGKSVDFKLNTATFDKGDNVAQLVVFYDSRRNLERRGIVVETRSSIAVRPNPFPGIGCKPPKGWQG